ncbi:MAG: sugar nucleotide-binding protein [Candidatus Sumerlaeia bacterium]|nr:sugar nucleotide-binding protein [Candidatus Sumerlaeia bacterium]
MPQNAIITGGNGTVGSVLARVIRERGGEAHVWNREKDTPGDMDVARRVFELAKPGVVFHLALPAKPSGIENESWFINEHWTGQLAWLCGEWKIPFVYCSTAMVFSNRAVGPFSIHAHPDETEGYGLSKLLGERAAISANPYSKIARLGWQIGPTRGGNNMLEHLESQHEQHGVIRASTEWLPATSTLEDTAEAFLQIAEHPESGVFHVNSNHAWNFAQIVRALAKLHNRPWKVEPTRDFVYDQRLLETRLVMPELATRLPLSS